MSEIRRILEQHRRAFDGNAWHGPAVREILADIPAGVAAAKAMAAAHSIWEIVLHIAVWENIVRRRLEGEVIDDVAPEDDWPPVVDTSEEAWKGTLRRLQQTHLELRAAMSRLRDEQLDDCVTGKNDSIYAVLHGIIQHDLYHAGQIALLNRAERRPEASGG